MNRFPSESLHSFSFAHQSEDILHSRQNILKKSIDFMRDRLGWAANSPGLLNAQAKASGDSEIQGMMDLLRRANVLQIDTKKAQSKGFSLGPLTGPADVDGANIFEKSFGITNQDTSGDEVDEESSSVSKNPHNRGLDGAADIRPPTPVVENGEAFKNLKHEPRRSTLKRTYTDISSMSLQAKLMEALAQPYTEAEKIQAYGPLTTAILPQVSMPSNSNVPGPHTRENKWAPAAQAVFRTESKAPWTIIAANDLACLIFGVTRGEVRRLGILEVVQEERRQWLEDRLKGPTPEGEEEEVRPKLPADKVLANGKKTIIGGKGGITAMLLSKANSRQAPKPKKAATDDGSRGYNKPNASKNHPSSKSRGVLLCGDVIPIQKRNGSTGSASFWVMEKRGGLIWVLEEITENMATLSLDTAGKVTEAQGDIETIWCQERIKPGTSLTELLPKIPLRQTKGQTSVDVAQICRVKHYTAKTATGLSIPSTTTKLSAENSLRVSSFPHIAGVMVISPTTLKIKSSNPVFSAALFGHEHPEGLHVNDLIPDFAELLKVLTEEDDVNLTDGIVIPEHSFRRARGILALREGKDDAASIFLRPSGLPAKHRDGSEIMIDVQMKVVKSGTVVRVEGESAITERDKDATVTDNIHVTELMYALWVTYSRQMHSMGLGIVNPHHPMLSRPITPPNQPSPPMLDNSSSPVPALLTDSGTSADSSQASLLTQQLIDGQDSPVSEEPLEHPPPSVIRPRGAPHIKKTINDFIILEDMGSGAYGQVKLGRHKKAGSRKMILKYVTKKRILVDTWTRDRRLGTVPLEIHVMDYLRRDGLRHPNIVEMVDFFEDDINYYIEMLPHGIPGMDLFDYIELRSNMEENECRNIFTQVADAIHHLHTKALVVHRDIKDENVVLDGESRIKLIDFGSAAYIKNGPFDVFVGTLGKLTRFRGRTLHADSHRLCCSRSPARSCIPRQRTRRMGTRDLAVHNCVQRKSLLQHRRNPRPPATDTLHSLLRSMH